jgi:PAS domain S-box-containing protein
MPMDDFTLVIIGDIPDDVARLRQHLHGAPARRYQIVVASTGEEGLRACVTPGAPRPDCVLLDFHLPDMDGLEVMERLKDDLGNVPFPVVVLTDSQSDAQATVSALRAGAQDVIGKAWPTPEGLVRAMENAVIRFGMVQGLQEQRTLLERRERELQALLEHVPEIIVSFDKRFRLVAVNPAVARLTGLPPERFIGKTYRELGLAEESCRLLEEKLRAVMEGGREVIFECACEFATGLHALQSRFLPEIAADGSVTSVLGIVTDVTERKQSEAALKNADRLRDEFLAMLVHELRNPLAAIRSAFHLLQLKGSSEPDKQWSLGVIDRQVNHLTRLIDEILDVSRISTGKIQLKKVPIDVTEVVARAAEGCQPHLEDKQQVLQINLPSYPLAAEADPARLEQVVDNLLTNAAKYTDNGGSITLSGTTEGGEVVIRVRDNGIGIDAEMLPQIFALFAQADSSLARCQGGLGIGLTLVKALVEMHGGTVSAVSEGAGLGSEFTVRIPALVQPLEARAETALATNVQVEAGTPPHGARVLVVDDNVDSATGLAMLLQITGHDVRTANDGPLALEIAPDFRPEFVLLDIGLPGMNGYELARAFRRHPDLKEAVLVAISGYGQREDLKQSQAAGFDHHLLKPVELEDLLPILDKPTNSALNARLPNPY